MNTVSLTPEFRQRVESTGMTHAALAAAFGVSRQYFSRVWNHQEAPSVRFMAGAVSAGIANHFGEVAAPTTQKASA